MILHIAPPLKDFQLWTVWLLYVHTHTCHMTQAITCVLGAVYRYVAMVMVLDVFCMCF